MSTCKKWVRDLVTSCASWASQTQDDCNDWANERSQQCAEWKDEGQEECSEWKDEGEEKCSDWEDEGYSQCCDWAPCSWFCDVLVWVSKWVCQGWYWAANLVCQGWYWAANLVCQAWVTVIVPSVCGFGAAIVTGACRVAGFVLDLGCDALGLLTARIVDSRDEPPADSVSKPAADCMSVAHVTSALQFRDSGERYFFRIKNGVVLYRTLDQDWEPLAPPGETPQAVSYKFRRKGTLRKAPKFDMVAANSGRVFTKKAGRARFFVAIWEPIFRREPDTAVPSMYFKLDPEQGESSADDQDRLDHLDVDDSSHPAALRFPLFRYAMQLELNDTMVVHLDRHLKVWHQVDGRPPKDGGDPPEAPGFPPTRWVVKYQSNIPFAPATKKYGYRIREVLDIGVGHEHWHEQRSSVYGGELDSLDGPGLKPCLKGRNAYRLFNGPVEDQGGFIDGTVNYYVLAQLAKGDFSADEKSPADAYGILWLDEQAVLSERWRLLDPDDCKFGSFKDVVPSAVVQYLEKDFDDESFLFDRSRFWCPMRAGHVNPKSRMAVSRAVICVTGRDPVTKECEIYSINFSFGTADRTWRWRRLPARGGSVGSPPESLVLREDMTLFFRDGEQPERYWYQRYLPASARAVPTEGLALPRDIHVRPDRQLPGSKPDRPIAHNWQWLPEDVFEFVHNRTTHFGCYQKHVDWRWQYYRVTVLEGEAKLAGLSESTPWRETSDQLHIIKDSINWLRLNKILKGEEDTEVSADLVARVIALVSAIPGGIAGAFSNSVSEMLFGVVSAARDVGPIRAVLCQIYDEMRGSPLIVKQHRKSLFHDAFVLGLRQREPFGWIMVQWDKRDDDLLPFRDMTVEGGTPFEIELESGTDDERARVRLRVESYHLVPDMPQVEQAVVTFIQKGTAGAPLLRVELLPCKNGDAFDENVWRVKLGCATRDEHGVLSGLTKLFDEEKHSAVRQSVAPNGWRIYEWELADVSQLALSRLSECCSEVGRQQLGTSLWFEDIVGHVATPDEVEYRQAGTSQMLMSADQAPEA